MNTKKHGCDVEVVWTGTDAGRVGPAFRDSAARWGPEQLQVAAVSPYHMHWDLNPAMAARRAVDTAYEDHAGSVIIQGAAGAGQLESATLRPHVAITAHIDFDAAPQTHSKVPELRSIDRSVNSPVMPEPVTRVERSSRQGRSGHCGARISRHRGATRSCATPQTAINHRATRPLHPLPNPLTQPERGVC